MGAFWKTTSLLHGAWAQPDTNRMTRNKAILFMPLGPVTVGGKTAGEILGADQREFFFELEDDKITVMAVRFFNRITRTFAEHRF